MTALGDDEPGPLAVVGPDGRLLALYEKGRASARPLVVLATRGPGMTPTRSSG